MATVYYSVSTKTNERGLSRILVRFSAGQGLTARAKTEIFVDPATFKKGRVSIPRVAGQAQREAFAAQRALDELTILLLSSLNNLDDRREATADWLKNAVHQYHHPEDIEKPEGEFLQAFDSFVKAKRYAHWRHLSFLGLKRILQRFEMYDEQELRFDTFDRIVIQRLDDFLRDEHKLCIDPTYEAIYQAIPESRRPAKRSQNTINGMHTRLRTFIRWAVEQGLATSNGYDRFKVDADVYGTPIYITIEERRQLYTAEMPTKELAVQRDIFVFQCCIGCRVSDLYQLTHRNIIRGAVEYVARKTRDGNPVTVRVPLTDTAKEIVARYKGDNRLLPFIAEQAYNRSIKKAFEEAGLTRVVTWLNPKTRQAEQRRLCDIAASHLARRTFAGNLYKKLKDPNVIASMTGHKEGSRAFARYRAIDEDIKAEAVGLLE